MALSRAVDIPGALAGCGPSGWPARTMASELRTGLLAPLAVRIASLRDAARNSPAPRAAQTSEASPDKFSKPMNAYFGGGPVTLRLHAVDRAAMRRTTLRRL